MKVRGIAFGLSVGLAVAGCSSSGEVSSPSTVESFTLEEKDFQPTDAGIIEVIAGQPDPEVWSKFAYLAGFFECSGSDIQLIENPSPDVPFAAHATFGDELSDAAVKQFTNNLADILTEYKQVTGDSGYKTWYETFRKMHNTFSQNQADFCEPMDSEGPVAF